MSYLPPGLTMPKPSRSCIRGRKREEEGNSDLPPRRRKSVWLSDLVGRRRFEQIGIEAQAGDEANVSANGGDQFDGRKAGVGDDDDVPGHPIARLRPYGRDDLMEIFYWSLWRERWCPTGPFGSTVVPLNEALRIIDAEPIFTVGRRLEPPKNVQSRAKMAWSGGESAAHSSHFHPARGAISDA
jgi:hypothetical protein